MRRYWEGLKFGMMLQLAVGPMCLMVFNTAKDSGFGIAMSLVLAIVLVDAFYIVLAGVGISRLLEKRSVRRTVQLVGGAVLILFGLNTALGVFGFSIIPGLSVNVSGRSVFLQGLVLTLSNPLTIVFWGGVLTGKLSEGDMQKRELVAFCVGLVSATLYFMTAVAGLGTVMSEFISGRISAVLNLLIGAAIIWFGIRMMVRSD